MGLNERSIRKRRWLFRQNPNCGICGLPIKDPLAKDTTLDHIIPRAKGGRNWHNNIQLAHMKCNSMKGDLDNGDPAILLHPKMKRYQNTIKRFLS